MVRACRRVRARWDPAASSSAGKCEDNKDGGGIHHPRPGSKRARRVSLGQSWWWDSPSRPGCKRACGKGLATLPLRPPLHHPAHPQVGVRVQCDWCGRVRGGVCVPGGSRGCGCGHICGGICNRVCCPLGLWSGSNEKGG